MYVCMYVCMCVYDIRIDIDIDIDIDISHEYVYSVMSWCAVWTGQLISNVNLFPMSTV